jgi:hypothetical protein
MPQTAKPSKCPKWDKLRELFAECIETRRKTIADVARELGRDYLVVYKWTKGDGTPNGEAVLSIVAWMLRDASAKSQTYIINQLTKNSAN